MVNVFDQTQQLENKTIRVFISSTFRDMQKERDILVKKIFPQLRKICEGRAVTFTEIDLRWGITEELSNNYKTISYCLAEIERCRPYFIGLLGERYGWIPNEKDIPLDLIENENTKWIRDYYNCSVTEMEIVHGVLNNPGMDNHAYFYFRDPDYIKQLPKDEDVNDFVDNNSNNENQKLAALKSKIQERSNEGLLQLTENYASPTELGNLVLKDFTELIDKLYPQSETPDAVTQENMRHEAYARNKQLGFVGREDMLTQIDTHIAQNYNIPLIVTGESGCGKSALLATWIAQYQQHNPDAVVIQHYIGSTPDSASWAGLVTRIISIIKKEYNIAEDIKIKPDELEDALMQWCDKTAGGKKILVALDALNQLHSDDEKALRLNWLPEFFQKMCSL